MMSRIGVSVVLISLLSFSCLDLSYVSAHADGAGACFDSPIDTKSFLESHTQPICPPTKSQFRLFTNTLQVTNTIVAGCKYTISLCGPKSFKGFIVYAQSDTMTPSRIGAWTSPSYTPSQLVSCSGNPSGTITHTNSANKMRADFMYKTPNYVEGMGRNATVTIQARIVVSLSEWYMTSIALSYLNIPNLNGGMCSDPATLPLSVCPAEGILDTSGCPAKNMSGMTGMDGMSGMNMSNMGNMGNMDSMSMSMGGMSMSSVFTTTWSGIQLVFPGFTLDSTGKFIGAMICCFVVAFTLEFIQWIQYRFDAYLLHQQQLQAIAKQSSSQSGMEMEEAKSSVFSSLQQLSRSCLHVLRVFLSLFLMMIWMTLNVGLVLAALGGAFIGFFCFSKREHVYNDEMTGTSSQSATPVVKPQADEMCC